MQARASEQAAELVACQLAIPEDAGQQSRTHVLADVNGDGGRTVIGASREVVAAANANDDGTRNSERGDELAAVSCGRRGISRRFPSAFR